MVRGVKTISEYMFRKWMEQNNFDEECFELEMTGINEAVIRDKSGDSMKLIYEPETKHVFQIHQR